jgi:hypothetical protein
VLIAYKWIRILFACWKNKVAYDDGKYVESLRRSHSPLLALIEQATETKAVVSTN